LLISLVLNACRHESSPAPTNTVRQVGPAPVQFVAATEQPVEDVLDLSAKVQADPVRSFRVFAPASGRVLDIQVKPGDMVRKGEALATIESADAGSAQSDLVKAEVGGRCLVLRAITQFGAIFREPGVVDYKAAGATLIEDSARSAEIAALFTACGLDGRISVDIKVEVWRKLIFNCVINPITSIIGSDVGTIADPRLDPLKQLVVDECLQVARADGVEFDVDFVRTIAEVFGSSRNIASMRQDLLKGKPTEIDHMNGALVDLGLRLGIACPVNAALVAIIKAMEARGGAQ